MSPRSVLPLLGGVAKLFLSVRTAIFLCAVPERNDGDGSTCALASEEMCEATVRVIFFRFHQCREQVPLASVVSDCLPNRIAWSSCLFANVRTAQRKIRFPQGNFVAIKCPHICESNIL